MCSTCGPRARKQIFSIRIFKCSVSIIPAQKFACLKIKIKLVLKVSTPHLSRPNTCKGIQYQTIQETTTGLLYVSVAGHRGCLASSARKKKIKNSALYHGKCILIQPGVVWLGSKVIKIPIPYGMMPENKSKQEQNETKDNKRQYQAGSLFSLSSADPSCCCPCLNL